MIRNSEDVCSFKFGSINSPQIKSNSDNSSNDVASEISKDNHDYDDSIIK